MTMTPNQSPSDLRATLLPKSQDRLAVVEAGDLKALKDAVKTALRERDRARAMAEAYRNEADWIPGDIVDALAEGGNPVRVWREHRGMNGKELAIAAGLSQSYVSELETGRAEIAKMSLDAACRLAEALDCQAEMLMPFDDAPPEDEKDGKSAARV